MILEEEEMNEERERWEDVDESASMVCCGSCWYNRRGLSTTIGEGSTPQ